MHSSERQQVLFLWLNDSALDSPVVGWAFHDGAGRLSELPSDDAGNPPYPTGDAALRDGWRLLQVSQLHPPYPGTEHTTSHLKHEFVFERIVDFVD